MKVTVIQIIEINYLCWKIDLQSLPKTETKNFSCWFVTGQVFNQLSDGSADPAADSPTGHIASLFKSADSQPGSPKSARKRINIEAKAAQNAPVTSVPLSPATKRLILIQKQTRSEASLLHWILKPSTCCCTAPRPSDPAISPQLAVDRLFTLTPLYLDSERESFEIRRSAPLATSPLPWASSQEPDYPTWIRNELRLSLRARPTPGTS